ncbi:hypothetical protein V5799_000469 [Amblyomma americanum]|uniref:DDE-1 domain-containing protein n=1 Tax=Amblyomma americanum TaxID=6943 RepID=A0AAQ4D2Y2_AMBAM
MSSGVVRLSQQIDERLLQFFLDEANAGREVNNLQLEEKALDIARELKLDTFTLVSGQYIECWRQQHGTTTFSDTNEDHKEPVEMQEATQASRASMEALSRRHMYRLDAVLAMDEVMVSITSPTADENDGTAGKNSCATIGNTGSGSEIGFTVALAACASGVKLPAFLILKEESGHIQEQALRELRVPGNIRLTASEHGWMTPPKFQKWVTDILGPKKDESRRLLVIDQTASHNTAVCKHALDAAGVDVVFLPVGCNGTLQPAVASWAEPFKVSLQSSLDAFILQGDNANNRKMASAQDIVNLVSTAWAAVSSELIAQSFSVCGITYATYDDGGDDVLDYCLYKSGITAAIKSSSC